MASDCSKAGEQVVDWAALMAERYGAELLLIEVVPSEHPSYQGTGAGITAASDQAKQAERLAGLRWRAQIVSDPDPSPAIVRIAAEEDVDVIVVGSAGMRGRKEFRPASVPNRVSHSAHCTVIIVNTSDPGIEARKSGGSRADRAAGRDDADSQPLHGELLRRVVRIGRVMSRHGLSDVLSATTDDESTRCRARSLRAALDELGPTFAKLGQILSTRPDLVGPVFAEELATLLDHVTPLTETDVVSLMERELGMPWEDVFDSIEPAPLAAGSIAQVHRAVLASGQRVVLKIQRSRAQEDILRDLELLRLFTTKAATRSALRHVIDLPATMEQLSLTLRQELDFRNEAESIERMRAVLAPFSRLDVPAVHAELSTGRLLVMEEVQGVPLRQAPPGHARTEAARQLVESYYEQLLSEGFFHADPHPGNLMWWNDKIYLIDLGMTGVLTEEVRELLLLVLLAFWQRDALFLADVLRGLAMRDEAPGLDERTFQHDLARLINRYQHTRIDELRLGLIFEQLIEIATRYGITLPASLALVGKALSQMQFTTACLDPTLDPVAVASRFFRRRLTQDLRAWADPRSLLYQAHKVKVRIERLMAALENLAATRPAPNTLADSHSTKRLENTIHRVARRLGLAVTAGSAVLATVISAGLGRPWPWLTTGLGAVGAGLVVSLVADLVWWRR